MMRVVTKDERLRGGNRRFGATHSHSHSRLWNILRSGPFLFTHADASHTSKHDFIFFLASMDRTLRRI